LVEPSGLSARVQGRGGEGEVRFDWQSSPALLPVWWDGWLQVVRWGNRDRAERSRPPTGWTWKATVEEGKWAELEPDPVEVPAAYAFADGVWFGVKQGSAGYPSARKWASQWCTWCASRPPGTTG
jgi:hypothetical protein